MQSGFYRFEHGYLSRAGNKARGASGRFHASSVASYMSNTRKTDNGIAINLPVERGELYSELNKHSARVTRANGRIMETFVCSFDKRMSPEHRTEALHRFMMAVTFDATIKARGWEHFDDPSNPHAHVIVIDSDDNGQPVAHFSRSGSFRRENSPVKGNPTVWLRRVWQDECNAVLEKHEYDFRVDMRSNLDRGIAEAQKKRGPEQAPAEPLPVGEEAAQAGEQVLTDHVADAGNMVPAQSLPSEIAPECPDLPPDDSELETYVDDVPEDYQMTDRDRVGFAVEMYRELRLAEDVKARIEHLEKQIAKADQSVDADKASLNTARLVKLEVTQGLNRAQEVFEGYQKEGGALKGWEISLGRFKIKSFTRMRGEKAAHKVLNLGGELQRVEHNIAEFEGNIDFWTGVKETSKDDLRSAKDKLAEIQATMGNSQTIEDAEKVLVYNMYDNLKGIRVDDLLHMVQDGEISQGEYEDALRAKNTPEADVALESFQQEGGQGL